jgi:hypothetical protein
LVTLLSGVAILARPDSALWGLVERSGQREVEQQTDEQLSSFCRGDGWLLRCSLTGESGYLARSILPSPTEVGLDVTLAFSRDEGRCRLLRPSRFLKPSGRWRVEGVDRGALSVEWRILCAEGIAVGGQSLVPPRTPLYFTATVSAQGDEAERRAAIDGVVDATRLVRVRNGRVSVLEGSGPWGTELNRASGYVRLQPIGTFDATPAGSGATVWSS